MGITCSKMQQYYVRKPDSKPEQSTIIQTAANPSQPAFQKTVNTQKTQQFMNNPLKSTPTLWKRLNSRAVSVNYVEASSAFIDVYAAKTLEDKSMILNALNNHFIFTSLTDEDKEIVVETMQLYVFEINTVVFEQDKIGKGYYVVRTGQLEVIANGKRISKIHPGEGFGELALLHESPRSATVKTLEKATMWGIERNTFRKVIEELNTQIYEQNREFLEKVNMLQPLSSQQKDSLAASLVSCKYVAGEKIITEGDEGMHLYIIKEGCVSVQKNNKEIARLYSGQFFGEMTLLYNVPRQASCVAMDGVVKCVALSREDLQKALGNQLMLIIEKITILDAINKSNKLALLSKDQKENILRDLVHVNYKIGDVVIQNQSQCQSALYIIISGRLHFSRSNKVFAEKGSCVGDEYVTLSYEDQSRYEDDIVAGCDMKIGELTKYQFEISIGGKYKEVVRENAAMNVLRKVYLFIHLDSKVIKDLFSIIKIEKYEDNDIILDEGHPGEYLYIVKRGKVNIIKNGKIVRTMVKHDYFGERALLFDRVSSASCVAEGKVSLWLIEKHDFINILNDKMRKQLIKRVKMQDERAELKDLIILKQIGKGLFSRVYLVGTSRKDIHYALKVIPRRKIDMYALYMHVLEEKKILNMMDFSMIINLVRTYKDDRRLYFLLEYVHGFELSQILRHVGIISNNDSLFYAASLILALQYIHERDIIYRDLNPDNIMVDTHGYVKLVDFGSSKVCAGRTYTLIGSPHYVAPEVIVGKGYNKNADLWSLGICIYEFLTGKVPFGEDFIDPYDIYESILEFNLSFPNEIIQLTDTARLFIMQLLGKFPETRCSGTIESLKKNEWFSGFDWDALISETMVAPYNPDIGDIEEEVDEFADNKNENIEDFLDNASDESEQEMYQIDDPEINEYKKTIPSNWDFEF
ncbi:PKG_7 [Blepharisma stoltei]|uniref:cGMP-dependent protein kinase n=1 Tax=Blepharisma stoltei TaxID=1481888 RepID=A0AAU9IGI3_9CILI|nr:unnamed protein product [Blepharisma stoltei]